MKEKILIFIIGLLGGTVTLNLINQDVTGDIVVDSI